MSSYQNGGPYPTSNGGPAQSGLNQRNKRPSQDGPASTPKRASSDTPSTPSTPKDNIVINVISNLLDLEQPDLYPSLRKWHKKFTVLSTMHFVWKSSSFILVFFVPWVFMTCIMDWFAPGLAQRLSTNFLVKAFTLLVGILVSLHLKESVDKYRQCLANVVDFRDEMKAFWYMMQTQTIDQRAARFIMNFHMVAFVLSVIRYMHRKYGVPESRAFDLVQPELQNCVLLQRTGAHAQLLGNPAHAELLLISWLRVLGVMDRDIRLRWEGCRKKLHALTTRVRTPNTAKHLLWAVLMVFLFMTPICSPTLTTKISTPVICMLLCSLLQLSEELEDPFGEDEHDLPLFDILSKVCCFHVEPHMGKFLEETMNLFNDACRTGHWDPSTVNWLFGEDQVTIEPEGAKLDYDGGKICLGRYLTLPDLMRIDVVGNAHSTDADVLFSNSKKMD
mmetsp:Transcript_115035/g.211606  ORF Transcript_115035/g.211606 Transcript_115035/m.211606 type:complete len:446 (-) Transcript_115035:35-1372(-)